MTGEHQQDLISYYDQDAGRRNDAVLPANRVASRQAFIDQLQREGRDGVVEYGCGPGHDGLAFARAGLSWVGLDLSFEHARLSVDNAGPAVVASLLAPPFRPGAFAAGWSMSTLIHVTDDDFDRAVAAIIATLAPGAPLALGLWGGRDDEQVRVDDLFDPPRFFSLRTSDRVRSMLAPHGTIERFDVHDPQADHHEELYQFIVLRTPG